MTALPDLMELSAEGLTVDDYEALSEEVCRRIEVVDGGIVMTPAPRRPHQRIIRCLSYPIAKACSPELAVDFDVDLRLCDVPLLNRRPDLVVYDATLDHDAVLRPEHVVLVVEVMSPGSVTTDKIDKPAEYAQAGIKHFWRVENTTDDPAELTLFRHSLDADTGSYSLLEVHKGEMTVHDPISLTVNLAQLF